jgi:PXPV repeat-containing protein
MKRYLTAAAVLIAGTTLMLSAAPAMARVDVDLNIGFPGVYAQPAPVYVQPRPVFVEPRPVFVQPRPVYVQPQPVYIERPYQRDWRERRWHARQSRDRDGDGVPNWQDRRPDNRYRY